MIEWYRGLAPRERLVLAAGAVIAIALIAWEFAWKPLVDERADLQERVAERTELLNDIRLAAQINVPGSGTRQGPSNQSILLVIDGAARTFGLAESFTQTRPNGSDEISVSFQRASFDTLIAWLIELETAYGITVNSITLSESGQPGLVNGQIFLRRG